MKLRNKAVFLITLVWVGLMLIGYAGAYLFTIPAQLTHTALISLTLLSIIFALICLWLLNITVLKRVTRLNNHVREAISRNEFSYRVDETGSDEIAAIAQHFNKALQLLDASGKHQEQNKILEKANHELRSEIAERKSIEQELLTHKEHLTRLAHYDDLTALPNRVFFNEMLNKTIGHANRHKKMMAILFIDLDRFKYINDVYGHPIGDRVLKEIANRFVTVLRSGDILARLGGDEFIILLNDINHAKFASPVAEKLLQICTQPILIDQHKIIITASIGICIYPNDGTTLEDLQANADVAMYNAKHAGSGIYQYYTKDMNQEAHKHLQMEAALRKAISNNEFTLYYQPKLNLKDSSISGVEALIRWEHPELGVINPSEFIPLAEETGLIMQLGEWALREACRANKAWQEKGYQPISIAVNLSPKQFESQDIVRLVTNILAETRLSPEYLELEITETAIMNNVESTIAKLNEIKKMGVHISIDDFGTGYTSISYLKKFPVSILKIDQNFIKDIPQNQHNTAITKAIIVLAHTLEMQVIAEGVETTSQLQYLANNGCDIVQGYYLSRPLPEQKIVLQFSRAENLEEQKSA